MSNLGTNIQGAVADLESLMNNLPPSDRKFADSLINGNYGYKRRGFLSEKQSPYVYKLLEKALGLSENGGDSNIGTIEGIVSLFEKAKQHLKFPKIILETEFGPVQIWVQGNKAKNPGAIGVLLSRVWMGRVHTDGTFHKSYAFNVSDYKEQILDLLTGLAQHPEETAAKYGKLSGNCCFCHKALSDQKSLAVGYGSKCANNYGLSWGGATLSLITATK